MSMQKQRLALRKNQTPRATHRPHLDCVQELLGDFATFWRAEPDPAERRKLLASLFDHIWRDAGHIVAVTPRPAFAPYFEALDQARPTPPKTRPKRGVTKAGATGVEPCLYTASESACKQGFCWLVLWREPAEDLVLEQLGRDALYPCPPSSAGRSPLVSAISSCAFAFGGERRYRYSTMTRLFVVHGWCT